MLNIAHSIEFNNLINNIFKNKRIGFQEYVD